MTADPDRLTIALEYAARGWPVFPLEPGGKRPLGRLVPHGFKQASTDPTRVREWWRRVPEANIGIATGVEFDVLDLDGLEARAVLRALMGSGRSRGQGTLVGPTVGTPRGVHLYVAATGRGNTTRLGGLAGVDWRGMGGYVVAAGSVRSDGSEWQWRRPGRPRYGPHAPILPAPEWLVELFDRRRRTPSPPDPERTPRLRSPDRRSAYWRALERAGGRVATSPEGTRNDTLNREAHGLARLVGGGTGNLAEAGDLLHLAARRAGLADPEAAATIASAFRAGVANPRRLDPPASPTLTPSRSGASVRVARTAEGPRRHAQPDRGWTTRR